MSVRDDLTLMGGAFDTNRIPAGDFYRALRLAVDLIERVAEENRQ